MLILATLQYKNMAEISVISVIYHLYHWRHDSPLIYTGCKASLHFEPRLALVHRWVSSVCSWEWMCHPGSHGSFEAEQSHQLINNSHVASLVAQAAQLDSAWPSLVQPGSACIAWAESVRTDATNGRSDGRGRFFERRFETPNAVGFEKVITCHSSWALLFSAQLHRLGKAKQAYVDSVSKTQFSI